MPLSMLEQFVPGNVIRKNLESTGKCRESRQAQEYDPAGHAPTFASVYRGRPVNPCEVAGVLG